ncbi:MAG: hypothetical protein Q9213_005673 [Squamulea squamosa]
MCIHHIKYHAPCGHTKQLTADLVYCDPVARAVKFYRDQPNEAEHGRGRFNDNPMKAPQPCGGDLIHFLRNIPPGGIIGQDRTFAPEGWEPRMTFFVKQLIDRREDSESIVILTETEFPQMVGRVCERWVHHMHECFQNPEVIWVPPQDLQNDHFGGNIITETVRRGCGRGKTENASCFKGWENPYGGIAVCPFIWTQETGQPIPQRPDHEVADLLPSATKSPAPFHQWVDRELQLQARDGLKLYGIDVSSEEVGPASSPTEAISTAPIVQPYHSMPTEGNGPVAGVKPPAKPYCWPPASTSKEQRSHAKSASI